MNCGFHGGLPSHPRWLRTYLQVNAADGAADVMERQMTMKQRLEAWTFAAVLFVGLPLSILLGAWLAG